MVAFSGGADSAFLAAYAARTLGHDRVHAVTAVSPSLAGDEEADCRELAAEWDLRWTPVITAEMERAAYRVNDTDRCFHCKAELMDVLEPIARAEQAVIVLGVNIDDLGDHRPGQKAAEDAGAEFPLVTAGFDKADVRRASRHLGLRTWDKPAAACLASRIPYGTAVTVGLLGRIDRAEAALHRLGSASGPGPSLRRHGAPRGRTGRHPRRWSRNAPRSSPRCGRPATATSRSTSRVSGAATSTIDSVPPRVLVGTREARRAVRWKRLPRLFRDRVHAGQALADLLRDERDQRRRPDAVVLALPRGGVPVAAEVARALDVELDVIVVRKIGVPGQEELAMGAIASGDVEIRNESLIADLRISDQAVRDRAPAGGRRTRTGANGNSAGWGSRRPCAAGK